jgi:nicotinamide mononucleotide transporter
VKFIDALLQFLQPLFTPIFSLWATAVTSIELLAFLLALFMVVLNMRVNPLAWPLAIISSLLYFGLFWNARLYGDASLQIFFAVMATWGWWQWVGGKYKIHSNHNSADAMPLAVPLQVRTLSARSRGWALLALLVTWPAMGCFLKTYTDTDVPWWDAFPTTASIIGQWLLGRKYIENWLTWLVVNIVSVGLFAYKGLWLTVLLYALFSVMSVLGWRTWQRLLASPAEHHNSLKSSQLT